MKPSALVTAATIGAAFSLALTTTAGAATVPTTAAQVTTTQQLTATAAAKPLVGDFNGDGRGDVFWYVPGTGADYLWAGKARDDTTPTTKADRYTVTTEPISGTYVPLVGDFNGDGRSDIFWYGPGNAADSVWYFNADKTVVSVNTPISGTYVPVVGNFDSTDVSNLTEQDDIFWYSTTGKSSLWSGNTDRTFSSVTYTTSPPLGAKPFKGNWRQESSGSSAPVHEDLLFYRAGTGTDAIWQGNGTGAFTTVPVTINGSYAPIIGDFNDNGTGPDNTDVFWYAPGKAADSVWMNTGNAFQSTPTVVNGKSYKPVVIPGTGRNHDDIMWNDPTGADSIWKMSGGQGSFAYTSVGYSSFGGTDPGGRTALTADFDYVGTGVHITDLLWYAPGDTAAQTEVLWMELENI